MTMTKHDSEGKIADLSLRSRSEPSIASINSMVAGKLREFADLLIQQGESGFRSRAFQNAANVIDALPRGLNEILAIEGRAGLVAIPTIGYGIAGAIAEILATGRWSQLDRLRGELVPETLFRTIPGIGPRLAKRLAEDGQLESLEDLESALHLGDLRLKGIGKRRKQMIISALAERLGRPARVPSGGRRVPSVPLLLAVDQKYRKDAAAGKLPKIAPRRFNPKGEAWLPIMHMRRDDWHFTALYSNSPLAHELNKTNDWVIIYFQQQGEVEGRCTVVTESTGSMMGKRVVRGPIIGLKQQI